MSGTGQRRERPVERPGAPRLAAWEAGPEGGPPVVLMHGLTMTSEQAFGATSPLTAAGFRAIGFDARGHGRSGPASGPDEYCYEALAADLTAVMDDFGVERAVVAGISMGSHTALRLALEAPRRVAGLAIVAPAFDPLDHPGKRNLSEGLRLAAAARTGDAQRFVDAMRNPAGLSRADPIIRSGESLTRRSIERHVRLEPLGDAIEGILRSRPFRSLGELAAIRAPSLVAGTRDRFDPGHPLPLARAYARAIPSSGFAVEEEGRPPLGWGGRRLTALLAALAAEAWDEL